MTKFRDAIESHLVDKDTFEKGTYRREKTLKFTLTPKQIMLWS
nr:hypothetical protein [Salmonella enterica]